MRDMQRDVARNIGGTVFVQGASAGLIFLSGLLLTRVLSPAEFGAYDYVDVWVEILMFFALLGFDRLLILKISVFITQNQEGLVRDIIRVAYYVVLTLSVVIGIGFYVLQHTYFSRYAGMLNLNDSDLALRLSILPLAAILLFIRALVKLNQAILQGFKEIVPAYLPDYVLRPFLLIVIVGGFWLIGEVNTRQALYSHIIAALLSLLLSLYLSQRFRPLSVRNATTSFATNDWLKSALPFTLISALTLLNLRGGSAILGTITDFETSALYGVSVRLTALISLALAATSAVLAPRIAALHAKGEHDSLQRMVTFSTRLMSAIAVPALLVLIFAGHQILGIFGTVYPQAYGALMILCAGQIINVSTGVVGWIVMMTSNEKVMALVLTIAAILHIILMIVLSPIYGLEGAAMATAISNVFTNVTLSIFSYRKLNINSTIF